MDLVEKYLSIGDKHITEMAERCFRH